MDGSGGQDHLAGTGDVALATVGEGVDKLPWRFALSASQPVYIHPPPGFGRAKPYLDPFGNYSMLGGGEVLSRTRNSAVGSDIA